MGRAKPLLVMDFTGVVSPQSVVTRWAGPEPAGRLDYMSPADPNWVTETVTVDNRTHFKPDLQATIPGYADEVKYGPYAGEHPLVYRWSSELVGAVNQLTRAGHTLWLINDIGAPAGDQLAKLLGLFSTPLKEVNYHSYVPRHMYKNSNPQRVKNGKLKSLAVGLSQFSEKRRPAVVFVENSWSSDAGENFRNPAANQYASEILKTPTVMLRTDPAVGISRDEFNGVSHYLNYFRSYK